MARLTHVLLPLLVLLLSSALVASVSVKINRRPKATSAPLPYSRPNTLVTPAKEKINQRPKATRVPRSSSPPLPPSLSPPPLSASIFEVLIWATETEAARMPPDSHQAMLLGANARSIPALAFLLQRTTTTKGNIQKKWNTTKAASTKLLEAITCPLEERKEKGYNPVLGGWAARAHFWATFYDTPSGKVNARSFPSNMKEVCSHDKNLPKILGRFQHIVGFTMILITLNMADWHSFKPNPLYPLAEPIPVEEVNLHIDCLGHALAKIKETTHLKGVLLSENSVLRLAERTLLLATLHMSDFSKPLPDFASFSDTPTILKTNAEWLGSSQMHQSSLSNVLGSIDLDDTIDDNISNKNNRNGGSNSDHQRTLSVARGLQVIFTALFKTTESMIEKKAADYLLRDILASSHDKHSMWNKLGLGKRIR